MSVKKVWDGMVMAEKLFWSVVAILLPILVIGISTLPATKPTAQAVYVPDPLEIAKDNAKVACREAIYRLATNKSSVRFMPDVFATKIDERIEVLHKFTSKNGYGSESASVSRCLTTLDGNTVAEIATADSR